MKIGCLAVVAALIVLFLMRSCVRSPQPAINAPETLTPSEHIATGAEIESCVLAKKALVASQKIYDRDYERRNPGIKSSTIKLSELDTCALASSGAFIGKFGGRLLHYVPKREGRFVANPLQVWISEEPPSSEKRIWYSQWRADSAPDVEGDALDNLLVAAEAVQ